MLIIDFFFIDVMRICTDKAHNYRKITTLKKSILTIFDEM